MKTNRYLSFCMVVLTAALLAGMVSCKKEKGPSELRAVMNDFATSGQKAYIDQEQYSCFVVGEKVRVNNSTGTITALERSDRQCVISGVAGLPEVTSFRAFYPAELLANQNVDLSNGLNNVAVTLPQEQVYETDANGNQIIKNPMMAELTGANENNSTLHFRNLCALLKITVRTNKAFDRIRVTMSGQKLWGSGKISGNKIIITSDGGSTVTLALPSGHHGSPAGEAFYIMVPEIPSGTVSCTVQIKNGADTVKSFSKSASAYFAACQIHTLGNFTFNAPVFTVDSNGGKVVFAPGNLQWSYGAMGTSHATASEYSSSYPVYKGGTWRFAEYQYDYVGIGNKSVSATCSTWVDLFAWGTSGYNYKGGKTYPYDLTKYCKGNWITLGYEKYDWGKFNTIYNPKTKTNDPYGTWRTLTEDEWSYLLESRGNWSYSNVKISLGSEYVFGLLVYPDNTTSNPLGSENTTLKKHNGVADKTTCEISETQYNALEAFGCVFLPAAGHMPNNTAYDYDNLGYYWTASINGGNTQYVKVNSTGAAPGTASSIRNVGYSVRLARDVQ